MHKIFGDCVARVCAVALLSLAGLHCANSYGAYPDHAIRLIVAAAPSGGADQTARTIQQRLGQELGQSIIIDNRAGASGIIGVDMVAKAAPDGYTLLLYTSSHMTFPAMVSRLPFDLDRDLAPITIIDTQPEILALNPKVPAHTMKELGQYAKTHPGELNYASGGTGTAPHIAGELFKNAADIQLTHVPYKGTGGVWVDLLSGRTQMMFVGPLAVSQYIQSGQLNAIAIADTKRSPLFPDVPTTAEAGYPTVIAATWYGLAAPAGTPQPVIDKIYAATVRALQAPDVKDRFEKMGVEIGGMPPDQFKPMVHHDIERFTKVLQAAGIKPE
jgi:tripartite-type tricarboxylate transporter receptor subunit TctC